MRKVGIVLTIFVALLALVCGFGGVTVALDITQPASSSTATVLFEVVQHDTTASVAQRLQDDGLIRNALLFRLWARYRHLDTGIEPGAYDLSPSMTMDAIIRRIQKGQPDEQIVHVPDTLRVTQYPDHLTNLKNFNAQNFLQIVKSGQFMDGTKVSSQFWFVEPKQPGAAYALEGYLYPDTYNFETGATEKDVVVRMLNGLGEQFCPGPAANPNEYLATEAQCKTHAVTIGGVNVFTLMEKTYHTSDDVLALYDTLTIASLTTREILSYNDAPGVAAVYYNRMSYAKGWRSDDGGTAGYMGSDPSAEYARDTDHSPSSGGHWWTDLGASGNTVDCGSAYNTESGCHKGPPPGPIAAPTWEVIKAAIAPPNPPNFYFVSDQCGNIHYWTNANDFNAQNAAAQADHQGCK